MIPQQQWTGNVFSQRPATNQSPQSPFGGPTVGMSPFNASTVNSQPPTSIFSAAQPTVFTPATSSPFANYSQPQQSPFHSPQTNQLSPFTQHSPFASQQYQQPFTSQPVSHQMPATGLYPEHSRSVFQPEPQNQSPFTQFAPQQQVVQPSPVAKKVVDEKFGENPLIGIKTSSKPPGNRMREVVPNLISSERFNPAMMKIIEAFRKNREGIEEPTVDYLTHIRCENCYKPFPSARDFGRQDIHELFYELIDPVGRYKLSINQASELLGIKNTCCITSMKTPTPMLWESYNYDSRYASGEVKPSLSINKADATTYRNAKVISLNPDVAVRSRPQFKIDKNAPLANIQKMESDGTVYTPDTSFTSDVEEDPVTTSVEIEPNGIVATPGTSFIGVVDVAEGFKIPVVSRRIKLADVRRSRKATN